MRRAAAMVIAFAVALAVYYAGSAPTLLEGDSAELQAIGLLGGVPHPSGYPAFALVSRLFGALGWGDPAFRITFMSSFCAALALSLLVLVLVELGVGAFGSLLGAGVFGSTFSFWSGAERAEVYSLGLCLFLLALWRSIVALRSARFGDALVAALLLGLTVCGHLMFGPMVAVLGAVVAWHVGVRGRVRFTRLLGLLAAFVIGLTPYLYLAWADTHSDRMNYLHLVDLASHPLGRPPGFDQPLERLTWLVFGRDAYPVNAISFSPRGTVRLLAWGIAHLALFEPGPPAFVLACAGAFRLRSRDARMAALLVGLVISSVLFTAAFAPDPRVLPIIIMPAVLLVSAGTAWGFEPAIAWVRARSGAARLAGTVLLVLAPVAMSLAAQAIRVQAARHPLTRLGLRVIEEGGVNRNGLVPSMRGYREPRLRGEGALAVIPMNALVVGHWREMMTLFYLRFVEGRRPDLTFQPLKYPACLPRLSEWQARYPLARRPIVFLQPHGEMAPNFAALDSVRTSAGEWIVIAREPLRGLPPLRVPPR